MDWKMDWSGVQHTAPQWFTDAKFGLFFHWGPYSVPACENEWYSRNMYLKGGKQNIEHERRFGSLHDFGYKDFIPMFTGERFDADEWAELTVRSGARYGGPVSEHADNYSMWDSRINPNNSVLTGPHRDVVGECARAFRARGLRFSATLHHSWLWGWFMSTDNEADVYDPQNERYYGPALPLETNRYLPYRLPDESFNRVWLEKVREVVDGYRPDHLYFDSRLLIIPEEKRRAVAELYYNTYGMRDGIITFKQNDFADGVGLYDVECGRFADIQPFVWETDDRLEDNVTWCIVQNPKYKSAARVIQQLSDVVSKNGNLLLNVGPCADGSFHPDAKRELYRVGDWLAVNGEAIYGTRPFTVCGEGVTVAKNEDYNVERLKQQIQNAGNIQLESGAYALTGADVRYTQTDDAVYIIGFGRPAGNRCRVHALRDGQQPVTRATMPGVPGALTFSRDAEALSVVLPDRLPFDEAYVIRLQKSE